MTETIGKLWQLLRPSQRKRAVMQAVLVLFGAALEAASIAAIIPTISLLAGDTKSVANVIDRIPEPVLAWLPSLQTHPLQTGLILLLVLYASKAAYLAFVVWRQAKLVANVSGDISVRLAQRFMAMPWETHLTENSSKTISTCITDVNILSNGFGAAIMFATELAMVAGIGGLLIAFEPLAAATAALVFITATLTFQFFLNARLRAWGRQRQLKERERMKYLSQAIHAIKEIRVTESEEYFLNRFRAATMRSMAFLRRQTATNQMPRLWYELVAVTALAALTFALLAVKANPDSILPVLALFAAAAFRLLPSATRLLTSSQTIRNASAAISTIHEILTSPSKKEPHSTASRAVPPDKEIVMSGVAFRYPNATTAALQDVTLTIKPSTTVGIIGASGAGKSTLTDILLCLLAPATGLVTSGEHDIHHNATAWRRNIGYVPQAIYLFDESLLGNIALGVPEDEIDMERINAALAAAQLGEFVDSLPDGLATHVGEHGARLSGGQKQRIGIARALYRNPGILILDEATSALDVNTERDVMQAVHAMRGEKTIIIVSHRYSTIEQADLIIRVDNGQVVAQGPPEAVLPVGNSA